MRHGHLGEAEAPVLQRTGKGRIGIRLAGPFCRSLDFGRFLNVSSVTVANKDALKEIIHDVTKKQHTVNSRFNLALNRRLKDLSVSPDRDDSTDFVLDVESCTRVCN